MAIWLLANSPNYLLFDCFPYSGERLDHLSCEALEVILKSLSFDFINLQAAELEENVSFMSKNFIFSIFTFQLGFVFSCPCVSDFTLHQRNWELHYYVAVEFKPRSLFFSFFLLPGSIILAGYDFVLWIYPPSWHLWQHRHGDIWLEGPLSFDKAGTCSSA